MAARKKNVVLTMQQRLEVLRDLKEFSERPSTIARKYNVSIATICRIAQNETKISAFSDKSEFQQKRRKVIGPIYEEVDRQLLEWFTEKRKLGDHVPDAALLKKASEIKDTLPSCSNFKVSHGWLTRFKTRHDIGLVKSSTDENTMKEFVQNFNNMIEEEDINLENVYNMTESGLVWKALPTNLLAEKAKDNDGEYKVRKDRITVTFCANALGTHKLKLLVIYKYKSPRALKHCQDTLPVIFKSQKDAGMSRSLFLEWYENYFKPSVVEYQEEEGLDGKVILLLEKCEAYKVPPEVENTDRFRIIYIPPSTTSILQPMDQGVIAKTKISFRHKLLKRVLTYDGGVEEFYKYYTIRDCIDILHSSWQQITRNHIKNGWNAIIKQIPGPAVTTTRNEREMDTDLQEAISSITGDKCKEETMTVFLSVCEEMEGENSWQEQEEEDTAEELMNDPLSNTDNAGTEELAHIFDRLTFYGTRAPGYIQHLIISLRLFFLGRED